jgi:hypothetical protein
LCARGHFAILAGVKREPLESRALRSAGYDAEAQLLEIEFRSGRVYRYEQVPASVYDWLLRAPNKGIFVTRQIAGRYPERALPDANVAAECDLAQLLALSLDRASLAKK